MLPTFDEVRAAVLALDHKWFGHTPEKPWDINVVSLRDPNTASDGIDQFTCAQTICCFNDEGEPVFGLYRATTVPGLKAAQREQKRREGIAIRVPGQERGSHVIRKHKGSYDAVCHDYNYPTIPVYRDPNRDGVIDLGGTIYTGDKGGRGLNIHKAGRHSTIVGNWSEGCNVLAIESEFNEFMNIARAGVRVWGPSITTTLIDWPRSVWDS